MDIKELKKIGVAFCDTDATEVHDFLIDLFQEKTGRMLFPDDMELLFIKALVPIILQQKIDINHTGKQNLLAFAEGLHLDNLGALTDTPRLNQARARTNIKFSLVQPLETSVFIPQGTVVTPDDRLFFKTDQAAIIEKGKVNAIVSATCETPGEIGNGFKPGRIKKIVNPVPYINKAENINESTGGADTEKDGSYRERIHLAPSKFSVAGPDDAYIYWAKTAHQDIKDVSVFYKTNLEDLPEEKVNNILTELSENPEDFETLHKKRLYISEFLGASVVYVCPLLKNGEIPDENILNKVKSVVDNDKIRPLTDLVRVQAPETVEYNIDFKYFITTDQLALQSKIMEDVKKAVETFVLWQKSNIGRDINPDKLRQLVMEAGAKRLEIISPLFTKLNQSQIAREININYAIGVENE